MADLALANAGATDTSFADRGLYVHRPQGSTQSVHIRTVAWLSVGRILALGGTAGPQSSSGGYSPSASFELDYAGKLDSAGTADMQTDDYAFIAVRELSDRDATLGNPSIARIAENIGCYSPSSCVVAFDPGPRFVSRQTGGFYGVRGSAVVDSHAGNAAILRDGRVVSLGLTYRFAAVTSDPAADVPVTFDAVALNAVGRRVPALESLFLAQMVRCSPSGTPIPGANRNEVPVTVATPNDQIIFAFGPCMLRLNADGTADTSFGTGGMSVIDNAGLPVHRVIVLPDGSLFTFHVLKDGSTYRVVKRLPNGQPDTSFGGGGIVAALPLPFQPYSPDPGNSGLPAMDARGRILIAGALPGTLPPLPGQPLKGSTYLARFDGSLKQDRTFGDPMTGLAPLGDPPRGLFLPTSIAIDDTEGIIVAGQLQTGPWGSFAPVYSEAVTRLLPDDDATVKVVEFYHAARDHYFITWMPSEIASLSAKFDWRRTGYAFRAYRNGQSNTSAVCRWYLPPGYGDSHFFGRDAVECAQVARDFPTFVLEDPAFMHLPLPVNGACPAGTVPVFRLFDNRPDANHRYTTSMTVRDQMVAKGWLPEGDGPLGIAMCAPG
ncbi:MAG: hypothetical protein U1F41_05765 [Burkholderiales bacterium]